MEFVRVTFDKSRDVIIDGNKAGRTNTVLRVEKGTHRIDLGPPENYAPSFRRPTVTGTNQFKPLVVTFDPAT